MLRVSEEEVSEGTLATAGGSYRPVGLNDFGVAISSSEPKESALGLAIEGETVSVTVSVTEALMPVSLPPALLLLLVGRVTLMLFVPSADARATLSFCAEEENNTLGMTGREVRMLGRRSTTAEEDEEMGEGFEEEEAEGEALALSVAWTCVEAETLLDNNTDASLAEGAVTGGDAEEETEVDEREGGDEEEEASIEDCATDPVEFFAGAAFLASAASSNLKCSPTSVNPVTRIPCESSCLARVQALSRLNSTS